MTIAPSKLTSRRFWVTLWAMAVVVYIVACKDPAWLQLANTLALIPTAYIMGDSYNKGNISLKRSDDR